jgi:hypothetical protein
MWEKLNAYRVSVGKPEGRGPLGRPRKKWRGTVEMCLKKYERERGGDWIYLAQDQDQ